MCADTQYLAYAAAGFADIVEVPRVQQLYVHFTSIRIACHAFVDPHAPRVFETPVQFDSAVVLDGDDKVDVHSVPLWSALDADGVDVDVVDGFKRRLDRQEELPVSCSCEIDSDKPSKSSGEVLFFNGGLWRPVEVDCDCEHCVADAHSAVTVARL